ncbi:MULTISPECIES: leucine efflux protein LeuE [unclassified Polynucleobacter]|uniref:leucine efflux protein LeuE n=2 Tax=Polynucleobacter TaxID=44013 RepID=UPI0025743660|nr:MULTISPECIES: leucine efflux protein LeuE [unclassified Polynucleobacter]BEI41442.1 leucine efflux protein LeuE [Polynucleobacter sp. HIN9]BEI43196.1 leucine efflux protein LeuE [Polynucleobacter sp. HIN10]BEI44973.1 leucine efflux protein LeuE [Polynucleobacter sp. HIN11]
MFQKALHYDTFPVYDLVMLDWMNLTHVGVVQLPTFILGTIAIVLLPGPNSLYVLTASSKLGWRAGVWASLGIVVGDSILMIAIVLGAASLLQNSSGIFMALRWLGAIYLLWLAWGLMQTAWNRLQRSSSQNSAPASTMRLIHMHPFVAALGLSLTNPKAIFFFISFFTQFVDPQFANPAQSFLYLAIILQMISITYLGVLIWVGETLAHRMERHPQWAAMLWFGVGALFIYFALRLLIGG